MNSERTSSELGGSELETFPFEDDPEFLELPEMEKEIQRQAYRNNMAANFKPLRRFSDSLPGNFRRPTQEGRDTQATKDP